MKYLLYLLCCAFTIPVNALLDLNSMEQSFILETKQIHIPGYPDAFNPSIIRWNHRNLMSFRSRDPKTNKATIVGFMWLDNNFNPIGKPRLLNIPEGEPPSLYIQDPRLCIIDGRLYITYSDILENVHLRKMCVAELEYDGFHFIAKRRDCFLGFPGDFMNQCEKNWVPFEYQKRMLLAYSISPHKIFYPWIGKSVCALFSENLNKIPWKWGELRGGTPAILIGNNYLSFFHSSKTLSTLQSKKTSMPHYFMGAYLFEAYPPFAIKKISPEPIVSRHFYSATPHKTWKPLRVVFPCGIIHDMNYIWISYGKQDHEAWIVKIDKAKLLESLVPFSSGVY